MNRAYEQALREIAKAYAQWCGDEEIGESLEAFIDWASPRRFAAEPGAEWYGRSEGEYVYGSVSAEDIAGHLDGKATVADMERAGWDLEGVMERWVENIWDAMDSGYVVSEALTDALYDLGYDVDDLAPEFQDVITYRWVEGHDEPEPLVVSTKVFSYDEWDGERMSVAVEIDGRYRSDADGEERLSLTGVLVEREDAEGPWEGVEEWGSISVLLPQDPPYGCIYVNAGLSREQREALYRGHVLERTGLTWPFNMETYEIARVCDPELLLDREKVERGEYEEKAPTPDVMRGQARDAIESAAAKSTRHEDAPTQKPIAH